LPSPPDTCRCCQPIGQAHLICGRPNAFFPCHCLVGPDWPCMLCTYSLLILPTYLFCGHVAMKLSIGLVIAGAVTGAVCILSYRCYLMIGPEL
jgi:hypothetical protein